MPEKKASSSTNLPGSQQRTKFRQRAIFRESTIGQFCTNRWITHFWGIMEPYSHSNYCLLWFSLNGFLYKLFIRPEFTGKSSLKVRRSLFLVTQIFLKINACDNGCWLLMSYEYNETYIKLASRSYFDLLIEIWVIQLSVRLSQYEKREIL